MKLSELKINVPSIKPRNYTYKTLRAKANAAGAHKNKKAELKRGVLKHKNQMHENLVKVKSPKYNEEEISNSNQNR